MENDNQEKNSENQKILFEKIHELYELHYYDSESMKYRERFFYDDLFKNLDLNNLDVAELASGSGHNSLFISKRFPKVRIVGYDISEKACTDFTKNTGFTSFQIDLTKKFRETKQYDVVIIIGGLHHCIVNLPMALENVHKMLKPKGLFLMIEPNNQFFLEGLRRFWYRIDKNYFDAQTEAALNHNELQRLVGDMFVVEDVHYMGGPAHLFILNSLIFRIPHKLKRYIAPGLFFLEKQHNRLRGKRSHTLFMAKWRKKQK